jgi:hypothetical protein
VWRLKDRTPETADCYVELTATGAYLVCVQRGSEMFANEVVSDWPSARRISLDVRETLIKQGWTPVDP